MKKCQLKNGRRVLLLLGIGILTFAVSFQSKAQVADPGPLVTVTLSGTEYLEDVMLAQVGDYDKIHEVTNLKVVGGILSSSDIWFLTEHMAYDADNSGKGKLVRLDLSDVDRIGTNSVDAGVLSLIAVKELILPNTVQILDGNAFMNSKIEYLTLGRDTWKVCGSLFDEETDRASAGEEMLVRRLEGMEYFRNIDSLSFENQPVKDMIPIRRMIKMEYLNMAGSDITRLDLSTMPVLTTFVCSRLSLTNLDFFYNGVITHIEAENMPKLTDINLVNGTFQDTAQYNIAKGNDALKTVHCDIGKETEYVTSLFESRPDVEVVSE